MPLKWISRSKSGGSKSRPLWAAHTHIGNVREYPTPWGVTLGDIRVHGAGFDNFCYQFLSRDAQIVSLLHICNKIPLGRASGIYNTHQATAMCCLCQQWLRTTDSSIEGMFK